MKELDVIDLPDGRRGTVVYASSDQAMIIVEDVWGSALGT